MVTHWGSSTDLYRIVQKIQYHVKAQFKNFNLKVYNLENARHINFYLIEK